MRGFSRGLIGVFFVLVLLIPCVSAATAPVRDSSLYEYDTLVLQLKLASAISLVQNGPSPSVESVDAELSWFPRESYRQTVQSITTRPFAKQEDDFLLYHWTGPRLGNLDYSLDATVTTSAAQLPVTEKIPFPITSLPSDVALYTEFGEIIDIDESIRKKALALAGDSDDEFVVVYNIADWVTTNIDYNLTSMTADASKPSTWVMRNRKGVCDEMTSLFISMLRSLNIPARFVSGVSYTNLPEFAEPWGGHGWAEVYFPGTGWVPFDVTYGTYGYVDATHITLKESFDADVSSLDVSMLSRDASLVTRDFDIGVDVLDRQRRHRELFTVTLQPFESIVGLDSANLFTAVVQNNANAYVSARLQVAQTQGLNALTPLERNILLKPRESKKLYFLVKSEGLSRGFTYTFPVKLYAGFRELASASFQARDGAITYDAGFFNSYLESASQPESSDGVALACTAEPEIAYVGKNVAVSCTFTNGRASPLAGLRACLDGCAVVNVPSGAEYSFNKAFSCASSGVKATLATVKGPDASASALVRYACLDEPRVAILDLVAPSALRFDERGELSFTLRKESDAVPTDVTVRVVHDNFEQSWTIERLVPPQEFTLNLLGSNLDLKGNEIAVIVSFNDALGKTYEQRSTVVVTPQDFTFLQKIEVRLYDLEQWFENLFA